MHADGTWICSLDGRKSLDSVYGALKLPNTLSSTFGANLWCDSCRIKTAHPFFDGDTDLQMSADHITPRTLLRLVLVAEGGAKVVTRIDAPLGERATSVSLLDR